MLFGWYDDGRVSGAVSMTPPYELLLAVVPDGSVDELAAELHAREVFVPGAHGEAGIIDRFVVAWVGAHRYEWPRRCTCDSTRCPRCVDRHRRPSVVPAKRTATILTS